MLFGTKDTTAKLTNEYTQGLPRGLFKLTAEFQELVTPMEMTDRTSVGVLI